MKTFLNLMEGISRWIVGLSMLTVVAAMAMQVFYRYVLIRPLAWTETMTKFAFVYCVFFGAFIGIRKRMHVVLDKIPTYFPPLPRLLTNLFVNALVICILLMSAFYGFALFQKSMTSLLPALNIPLGYIYLPFAVTCILTVFSIVDMGMDSVRQYREGSQND